MTVCRGYHSCAVYQSALHSNRPIAIVAGGWVEDGNHSSTEILDFTINNVWTKCKYTSTIHFLHLGTYVMQQ